MLFGMDVEAVGGLAGADRGQEIFNFVAAYWGSSWYDFFWSALERISALAFHLSASVLVYQSIKRKNLFWLVLAILWHTLLDAVAVYGSLSWGIPATEGALFIIALLGVGIIFALREPQPELEEQLPEEPAAQPPLPEREVPQLEITSEKLDESRYD
jgi:ABC-type sugar transport system permease subunit